MFILYLNNIAKLYCRIHTTARELPNKRMAIQLTVTSNLPWAATLTALTLHPQHGFRLDPPGGPAGNLCPLVLTPGATASSVMFVTSKSGGRSASRSNMMRGGAGQGKKPGTLMHHGQLMLCMHAQGHISPETTGMDTVVRDTSCLCHEHEQMWASFVVVAGTACLTRHPAQQRHLHVALLHLSQIVAAVGSELQAAHWCRMDLTDTQPVERKKEKPTPSGVMTGASVP